MKALDRIAIQEYGIPGLILMENAGRGIADLAEKMLKEKEKNILVVCGKGNNGGDGLVAARHLSNRGFRVKVVLLAKPDDLKDGPKINFNILKRMRVPVILFSTGGARHAAPLPPKIKSMIRNTDLIIDGIFGVGLTRPVMGFFYDVISAFNTSGKPILAIDVPSGIDSDSGSALGIAVRAKQTGTLGAAKEGLLTKEGFKYAGKVSVLDISIPRKLFLCSP